MDFLLLGLELILLGLVINLSRSIKRQQDELKHYARARQSMMRSATRGSIASPQIDARARTTKRDTDDLPLTGRISRLPLRNVGGEN